MQQQRRPNGRFPERIFEIKFQKVPDLELRAQLYNVRQRIFLQLGQLDLRGETIELSGREWTDVRGNVLGVAEGVVWENDGCDVITIGIRGVRNLVQSEVRRSGEKKEAQPVKKPGEIKQSIQIAMALRIPAKGALSRRWKIWFNRRTKRYEYRSKGLSFKGDDGELLTQKQVQAWMRAVNS